MFGSHLADEALFGGVSAVLVASVVAAVASFPSAAPSDRGPVADEGVEEAPVRFVDISSFAPPRVVEASDEVAAAVAPTEGSPGIGSTGAPAVARVAHARASRPAVAHAPRTPRKARAKPCDEPSDPAIRAAGDDHWTVDRSVLQRYTRDWSRLDDLGWSKVHEVNGEADGFQLGGVRCGSDLWDAGIRSGDVIHSVNGRAVHSVPQAVLAYTALRGEDRFVVRVTRKGELHTLRYHLD